MASESTGRTGGELPVRRAWWAAHDPTQELQNLWGELSRLVERAAQDPTAALRHWMPVAEEEDTGGAYVVRAELPGIPRERITVELDGKELHISGSVDESIVGRTLSRRQGSFSYGIRVPGDVDPAGIQASLVDGVLTVTLPKSGEHSRRSIDIEVAG